MVWQPAKTTISRLWSELKLYRFSHSRQQRALGQEFLLPADLFAPDRKSIAVLPFLNENDDSEADYFSDGISEDILNLLARLPNLRVISRTSSFLFRGKQPDMASVTGELNVESVLTGTVFREQEQIRITALLEAAPSGDPLWSESFERGVEEIFAIQGEIVRSVTAALELELSPEARNLLRRISTTNARAYDHYLHGRSHMLAMTRDGFEQAIDMFQKALEIDPQYGLAYAGIADAYAHIYRFAEASHENAIKARRASDKAIEMEPDSSTAHASCGLARFISGDYRRAEQEFAESIKLNPYKFEPYYYSGLAHTSQGHFNRAVKMYRMANQVNPSDYQPVIFLSQAYASLGRKQDEMDTRLASISLIRRHIKMFPDDTRALCIGASQLNSVGKAKKGLKLAERALDRGGEEPLVLYNVACFFALRGETDRALDLLEHAMSLGWGDHAWLETDSDLDSLREHPRFKAMLMGT